MKKRCPLDLVRWLHFLKVTGQLLVLKRGAAVQSENQVTPPRWLPGAMSIRACPGSSPQSIGSEILVDSSAGTRLHHQSAPESYTLGLEPCSANLRNIWFRLCPADLPRMVNPVSAAMAQSKRKVVLRAVGE